MQKTIEQLLAQFATFAWGPWLVFLLVGGGVFFVVFSRLLPVRYLGHAIDIARGKYYRRDDPGDITPYQALSSALAGTIGMGNIAGVAVAITTGGPGAVFWMWISALVGIATKFFTCSLALMYRGRDSAGQVQGGPMYVITEGMGRRWRPLAVWFAVAGLVGCLPMFQVNQLVQVLREVVFVANGWLPAEGNHLAFNLGCGLLIAAFVSLVIFGGIHRIGVVTSALVPVMVAVYLLAAVWIVFANLASVPGSLWLIISDAFTGQAVAGGALGTVISTGIRRAAFSNEAGIGTEALVHGAAKNHEPIRQGLVASLGPVIDTLIVCTATSLVILITGTWQVDGVDGVTLTVSAFEQAIPGFGAWLLVLAVFFFSTSTMFTYSYYGNKCWSFLAGAERGWIYNLFYVTLVVVAAVISLDMAINLIDGMFAMMAIPTMLSTLYLAPRVMRAARRYFSELENES
ncbi:MAG: alanine:cation symporter family protein [Gammaproteobacteria bacterium]|jgi:AGCS family alanine or glycine:cation symporter|nr:alanine:cation symporter family protein [Gammaproteobacteria bacterium]